MKRKYQKQKKVNSIKVNLQKTQKQMRIIKKEDRKSDQKEEKKKKV